MFGHQNDLLYSCIASPSPRNEGNVLLGNHIVPLSDYYPFPYTTWSRNSSQIAMIIKVEEMLVYTQFIYSQWKTCYLLYISIASDELKSLVIYAY